MQIVKKPLNENGTRWANRGYSFPFPAVRASFSPSDHLGFVTVNADFRIEKFKLDLPRTKRKRTRNCEENHKPWIRN